MLRVRERWEHSSYWITSPFSPSNILITCIFAAILVFTFYGKIQLFIVCLKYKRPDFPNTAKTKAVTQPQFISYLMIQKPGPNQLLASADESLLKCMNCTCFYQWLLWLITAKINILCSLFLHRILLTLYSVQAPFLHSSWKHIFFLVL